MPRNLLGEYIELMGHKPPTDTSEQSWQWSYKGTRAERATLLERLGIVEPHVDQMELAETETSAMPPIP